jgi:AcrR family transcriptional regulator
MPRKAKIRPDEPGRDRVLEAARTLFAERGFDATSIAEIGERAGISKSVLYHYFGSKAQLYQAILEEEAGSLTMRVRNALPKDPDAPRLRAGVDAYLSFLAERPDSWRLLLRDPPADPDLRQLHDRLGEQRAQALERLLAAKGKRAAHGAQIDLVATAIRAFTSWWYEHREVPREQVTDAILDVAAAGARNLT